MSLDPYIRTGFGIKVPVDVIEEHFSLEWIWDEKYKTDNMQLYCFNGEGDDGDQYFLWVKDTYFREERYPNPGHRALPCVSWGKFFEYFTEYMEKYHLTTTNFVVEFVPQWWIVVTWS